LSRLGLFAGAWVDRIRCLPVLVFADLGRAVLFGSIPVAALFGVLTLTQLYVVLVLTGVLTVLFDVAHSSYPPRLLQPDQLMPGNAKLAANHSVAAVLGAGAGGVLVQWLSAAVTIGVDALSFLWSALWLRSIRTPEPRPAKPERPNLRREIADGMRYVFRHPLLRPIAVNTATTMLFQAAAGSAHSSACTPPCGSPAWPLSPARPSCTSPRSALSARSPPYRSSARQTLRICLAREVTSRR